MNLKLIIYIFLMKNIFTFENITFINYFNNHKNYKTQMGGIKIMAKYLKI